MVLGSAVPLSLILVFSLVLFSGCSQTTSPQTKDTDNMKAHENSDMMDDMMDPDGDGDDHMMQDDDMMNATNSEMMESDMMMHSTNTEMMEGEEMMHSTNTEMMEGDMMNSAMNQTIKLSGKNFLFLMDGVENPTLHVKKGEKVRIEFVSEQGYHDFVVDELDVHTKHLREGDPMTFVEFTPEQTGEFEYYCSVGQHRANGMKGKIIVE